MVEMVTLGTDRATITGDVVRRMVGLGLQGSPYESDKFGTATFIEVSPTKYVRWRSVEVLGRFDSSSDSVRVRVSDGTTTYWMDASDEFKFKEVTATDWESEYIEPSLLGNMDLWTSPRMQIIVYTTRATGDDPIVGDVRVLMEFPTWTGAVAQSVKDVVDFVANVHPVLIEDLVVSTPTSKIEFNSANEHNIVLVELVQVTVDGAYRSASLQNGDIYIEGSPVQAGSTITIAARYKPTTTVRRVSEVSVVNTTPAWWIQDLVVGGGLNGKATLALVGGDEIKENRVELRMIINGIAHRQKDALAMRLALHEAFAPGVVIEFPSGRCSFAQIEGLVEVADQGNTGLPMATAVVNLVVSEFVYSEKVRRSRKYDDPNQSGNEPIYSGFCIDLPGGVSVLSDFQSLLS